MKTKQIKRTEALTEMEVRENSDGTTNVFSIRFLTKEGESIYLPHAKSSGLRADMTKNRLRGVQPCTSAGESTGHVYPVSIDNIMEFNGKQITL